MNIALNTAATIATLIVITVTAIAAYVQLRHMRTANQLEALLTVLARLKAGFRKHGRRRPRGAGEEAS